jgi:peptidoglycan/LPS O-acetylase OafA/YrhL
MLDLLYRPTKIQNEKINNFDLIRLFAALQVVLIHGAEHFHVSLGPLAILRLFPGVPIFFFISGFLITQSWENIKVDKVKTFTLNRIFRLYPGLTICLLVSLALVFSTGYIQKQSISFPQLGLWGLAQLTFVQFYNPDFFRSYGVGVVNGSLWTICVELQFYLVTPLIVWLIRKHRWTAVAIFLFSVVLHSINENFNPKDTLGWKLFAVTFAPWVFMFMAGAYVALHKGIRDFVCGFNTIFLLLLALLIGWLCVHFHLGGGNGTPLPAFLLLAALILKLAFTKPTLANSLLNRNDISYGIYIYHMPIINWILYEGYAQHLTALAITLGAVITASFLSWKLIESPVLRRKKVTLQADSSKVSSSAAH